MVEVDAVPGAKEDEQEPYPRKGEPRGARAKGSLGVRGGHHLGRGRLTRGESGLERIPARQCRRHLHDRSGPAGRVLLEAAEDDAFDERVEVLHQARGHGAHT